MDKCEHCLNFGYDSARCVDSMQSRGEIHCEAYDPAEVSYCPNHDSMCGDKWASDERREMIVRIRYRIRFLCEHINLMYMRQGKIADLIKRNGGGGSKLDFFADVINRDFIELRSLVHIWKGVKS